MAGKRAAKSAPAEDRTRKPKKQKSSGQTNQAGAQAEASSGKESTIGMTAPTGSTAGNLRTVGVRQSRRNQSTAPIASGLETSTRASSSTKLTWSFPGSDHLVPPPPNAPFAGFSVEAPSLGLELSRVIQSAYSHRTALLYSRVFTASDVSVQLRSIKIKTVAVASLPANYTPTELEEVTFADATTVIGDEVDSEYVLSVGGYGAVTVFQGTPRTPKGLSPRGAFFLSILDPEVVTVNGFKLKAPSEALVGPLRQFTALEIRRQPIFLWVSPNPPTLANEQAITQHEQDTHWIQESRQRTNRNEKKRRRDVGADSSAVTSKGSTKAPRLTQVDLVGTEYITPFPAAHYDATEDTVIASCQSFRETLQDYELQLKEKADSPTERIDLHDLKQTNYPRFLNLALASVTESMVRGYISSVVDLQEYKSALQEFDALHVRTTQLLQIQWYHKDDDFDRPQSHAVSSGSGGFYYLIACQAGADPFRIIQDRNQSSNSFFTSSKTAGNIVGDVVDKLWQADAAPMRITHPSPSTADTVGILPVLNGWAIALGATLDICPESRNLDEAFFKEAVRLIDLAISGYMDYETIVEFFDCHRYLDPEDLRRVKATEKPSTTTRMDSIERWRPQLEARARRPLTTEEHGHIFLELFDVAERERGSNSLVIELPEVNSRSRPGEMYLDDEQIFLSIAAVSEAEVSIRIDNPWCITWHKPYKFARMIQPFEGSGSKYRVSQPGRIFILPWLEGPEGENVVTRTSSKGNHWILAVVSIAQNKHVTVEFFDSSPEHLQDRRQMIAGDVLDIVQELGWNADPDNSDAAIIELEPEGRTEIWKPSPLQYEIWPCGYHTILNAWAYMLQLELNQEWKVEDHRKFHAGARRLIQYVTSGMVGSEGIYSFLAFHDYVLHVAAIPADRRFKKGKRFERRDGDRGLRTHIVREVRELGKEIRSIVD